MPSSTVKRQSAAVMFTDIAGYTSIMASDEEKALSLLQDKRKILKPLIKQHDGVYVKGTGDGTLSYFDSAYKASKCAKLFQESIYDNETMNVRVGIHVGDIVLDDGDVYGDGVNVASRLESMSPVGGICVSNTVYDELRNKKEFDGVELGLQSLKGVGRLIEIYGLKGDLLTEPKPSDYQDNKVAVHSDDEVPSIAIIPFNNKGKKEDAFYAYGICSHLISDCNPNELVRIASLQDIEKIENWDKLSSNELASQLYVRYIAQGTLWKMEDKFNLSIEIYDTQEMRVLWADNWQDNWDNLPIIKSNLSDGILKALDRIPCQPQIETNNPKAYEYYLKAWEIYREKKNSNEVDVAKALINKSINLDKEYYPAQILLCKIYKNEGDLEQTEEILSKLIEKSKLNNNKRALARSYYCYADMLKLQANMLSAIDIQKKALKIYKVLNDNKFIYHCYGRLYAYYSMIGRYSNALDYVDKSISILVKLDDKIGLGGYYGRSADIYARVGDFRNALKYFNLSLDVILNNDEVNINRKKGIEFEIYQVYSYMGDFKSAIKYFLEYYEFIKTNQHSLLWKVAILWQISEVYLVQKENNNAFKYIEKALEINDNTQLNELSFQLDIIYNLAKKRLSIDYSNKRIKEFLAKSDVVNHPFCRSYRFTYYYFLYELFEDSSFLKTAYNRVQEKADNLNDKSNIKFLSYPIPKAIVEEWEKIN